MSLFTSINSRILLVLLCSTNKIPQVNFGKKVTLFYRLINSYFFSQNINFEKRESANFSFSRILQFSQNTGKFIYSYAKYSLKFYAKYKSLNKMLRKIQDILLRKIQVSQENVSQNTVINCCA